MWSDHYFIGPIILCGFIFLCKCFYMYIYFVVFKWYYFGFNVISDIPEV